MTTNINRIVCLTIVTMLFTAGCTTVKPVYDNGEDGYQSTLQAGDRVRLTYLSGMVREIDVAEVTATEIRGTTRKNTPRQAKGTVVVADWQDIDYVESVKVSPMKTTGAVVGTIVAIPVIAVFALMGGMSAY